MHRQRDEQEVDRLPTTEEVIAHLARKCAHLPLRDARALFDALYMADAVHLERGNRGRAADRAGIGRAALCRQRNRNTMVGDPD